MKRKLILFVDRLFNLKMEDSEQAVTEVKRETNSQISQTKKTLKKAGNLQQKVMMKTTTYYIGRSMGVVK